MIGLLLIIPAAFVLFAKLPPTRAALFLLIGAILFAPELVSIELPFLSPIGKNALASLCAFIGLVATSNGRIRRAKLFGRADALIPVMLLSGAAATLTNLDTLTYGPTVLAGFGVHNIIRPIASDFLGWVFPYWIGRICVQTEDDVRELVKVFVTLGAAYLPLILVELRFSPQMHAWVFGYAQHDFSQTVRAGGYRPMVFMEHGLALAIFLFILASLTLAARRQRLSILGFSLRSWAIIFSVVIVAAKSTGALIFLVLVLLLTLLLRERAILRISAVIAALVIVYPISRAEKWFPVQQTLEMFGGRSSERSRSLEFRFINEDMLLEKAMLRPWFGWGGNARARVFDESGRDISVTDGAWIIILGNGGVLGFLCRFGFLSLPIWRATRRANNTSKMTGGIVGGFAVMLALAEADLIPNGMFNVLPVLLAGALMGIVDAAPHGGGGRRLIAALRAVAISRYRGANTHVTGRQVVSR